MTVGPLRTLLFASAANERHMQNALAAGADSVIFDLEDSVALSRKLSARSAVAAMASADRRCSLLVRINGLSTPYAYGDCVTAGESPVDGILVPKTESAADVRAVDWVVSSIRADRGAQTQPLHIFPIVETALGLENLREIAQAS